MSKQVESWRGALSRAAELWKADKTSEAIRELDASLNEFPDEPLPIIQKYYMEKSLTHRGKAAKLDLPNREANDPTVSVLLASYNRNKWIRDSIQSMLDQKFCDWELIVINDGGSNELERIVSDFNDSRIRYLWKEHGGLCAALNAGLAISRGKYFSFIDDDDLYYPEHLENLTAAMNAHPEALIVFSEYMLAVQELLGSEYFVIEKKKGRAKLSEFELDPELLKTRNFITTIPALTRREAIAKSGGFNETLTYCVHWDLWLRISPHGKIVPIDGASCEYRKREDGTNMTSNASFRRIYFDNVILSLHKGLIFDADTLSNETGKKVINALKSILKADPEMINILDIRSFISYNKPYRYFEELAQNFENAKNETGRKIALRGAIKCAPFELKLWLRLLRGIPKE